MLASKRTNPRMGALTTMRTEHMKRLLSVKPTFAAIVAFEAGWDYCFEHGSQFPGTMPYQDNAELRRAWDDGWSAAAKLLGIA